VPVLDCCVENILSVDEGSLVTFINVVKESNEYLSLSEVSIFFHV
jgi:hypothetical protein